MAEPPRDAKTQAEAGASRARADLAQVNAKVEAARAVLTRLLNDVVVAETRLENSQAAQLLAANEQLVVTALRNQAEAETAAMALAAVAASAELDALTKLPNRVLLLDRFAQAIAHARRDGKRLAVLFLDLNNFKDVNDNLGHAVGDEVLKLAAHRLVAAVRDADTVSRYGGDEFVILLTEIGEPADAGRIAAKLATALGSPGRVGSTGDMVLRLTASIGISVFPDDGDSAELLVERADAAMYRAKRSTLGSVAFHGQPVSPEGVLPVLAVPALLNPVARHAAALEEQHRRHAELREANEQLVLAVMTAQELQAAAEQAQQRQAEFLGLVADELGHPLTPIRMAAAMLGKVRAEEPLLPRARAMIEQQVQGMTRLLEAMHAMQSVSHAATLAAGPERRVIDLAGLVNAAVAGCRAAMDVRLQALSVELPDRAVPVLCDPLRLEQVVANLLDNASQYTPDQGRIMLTLAVQAGRAVLTVADTGIGITALTMPRLFEPFVQDIPAIGFNGVGVGLGLAVVRAVVEAHGGTVQATSAGTGRGTQFTVSLPMTVAA